MAQLLVIGAIEIAIGLAGVGMMIPSLIPPKPVDISHTTTVRIGVGQEGLREHIDNVSFAGGFPYVMLYDGAGRYVGRNRGNAEFPHIDAGGFKEVTISHEKGMDGVGSEYMALAAAGDDAICINFISMVWPNGVQFGFLGDVGQMCGADWHYSDIPVVNTDSSSVETPVLLNRASTCVWLDKNYSEQLRFQGMGIHIIDFSSSKDIKEEGRAKQYHYNKKTMCSSPPRFKMYEKMDVNTWIPVFWPRLKYKSDNTDADLKKVINNQGIYVSAKKRRDIDQEDAINDSGEMGVADEIEKSIENRSARTTPRPKFNTLIKSPRVQHSAKALCNSDNSRGPDFVSVHEGLFCDMDTKQVWPLCSVKVTHACFDIATNDLRPGPKGRRDINGRVIPKKSYSKELKWGGMK